MNNKQKQLDADIRFAHNKIQMLGAMFPVDAPERHPAIHLHLMEMADTLVNLANAPMQVAHYDSLIARCKAAVELLEYLEASKEAASAEAVPAAPVEQKEVFSSVRDALKESRTVATEQPDDEYRLKNLIGAVTDAYIEEHPEVTFNRKELQARVDATVREYHEDEHGRL